MPIISSGGLIRVSPEAEREGVRNMLLGTEQSSALGRQSSTDDFHPGTLGTSPVDLGISVGEFLTMTPEQLEDLQANFAPAIGQQQQQVNAPANQGRAWEGQEIEALNFTFGETVGRYFRENMKFEPEKNHNPYSLKSLGNLIEEATYEWQRKTGRYIENEDDIIDELVDWGRETAEAVEGWVSDRLFGRDEESEIEIDPAYHYKQLYRLELSSMQHAEAVKHWFYVSYGLEYGGIGSGDDQLPLEDLWSLILDVLNLEDDDKTKFEGTLDGEEGALRHIVNNHYGCVIKEMRDAELLPVLRPTADTQITTFATVRSGG